MGMVVRTNIGALNAHRNLGKNSKANSNSLEKLASGFRINRAGDDASGLAISEKMKAQIKALGTASDNCEDGISLVQTAEGYLGEVHDMLNRMVELAEKSANGINEDSGKLGKDAYGFGVVDEDSGETGYLAGTDRAALQAEMDQLCAEIDRIALTANFNGNKLFNGAMEAAGDEGAASVCKDDGTGFEEAEGLNEGKALALQIGETSGKSDKLTISLKRMTTDNLFTKMTNATYLKADGSTESEVTEAMLISNAAPEGEASTIVIGKTTEDQSGTASAWVDGVTINISDQCIASKAAELIRDAIDDVSMQRAQLGATQNRLDYTINNLNTAEENMNSANSRIRDTDMAEEMMKYTQTNVLTQAAQSMLAQANTQPQNILSLLQ